MSQHEHPGAPASALLNDDGSVDTRKIRALENSARGGTITARTCHRLRYALAADETPDAAAPIIAAMGLSSNGGRTHLKGECTHIHAAPTHPPLAYDTETRRWRVADE